MKSMRIALPWVVLLALSLAGCGNNDANRNDAANNSNAADSTLDAQAIYKQNCVSCHGGDLEGNIGPSLQAVGEKYEQDQIQAIITNGQGQMPAFKNQLDEQEIAALAAWLEEYSK